MIVMTGVEILATEEVLAESIFNWITASITGVIVLAIIIAFGIGAQFICDWDDLLCGVFFGAVIGIMLGSIAGIATAIPIKYETRSKVIISDEVSMNEFIEKYEVLDQEGKIYTVRERE